jgi:hypothetical protein
MNILAITFERSSPHCDSTVTMMIISGCPSASGCESFAEILIHTISISSVLFIVHLAPPSLPPPPSQSIAVLRSYTSLTIHIPSWVLPLHFTSLNIHFSSLEFLANSSLNFYFSSPFFLCDSFSRRAPWGGTCGQSHGQGGSGDWLSEMIGSSHQIQSHGSHEMIALIGTRLYTREREREKGE